jgi:threonine dehydrogenase-like Zn-dependent dehydrogenase
MSAGDWLAAYEGRTVVVIASGPSLTAEDCEAVRAAGLPAFVTNTTFRMCPWADVLLAHDSKWWRAHGAEAEAVFAGIRFRCGAAPRALNRKTSARTLLQFRGFGNTGCAAISLAALAGARRVILLGVDCQRTGGATHWHGDHPPELSNAKTLDKWPRKFEKVAAYAKGRGCTVVNASRETALTCFPRVALEQEIG